MEKHKFTNVLKHPEQISEEDATALKALIKSYPYLQPARTLYLKSLKQNNSYSYNNNLKKTAAYTTDRSVLFDFITSDNFNQNKISEDIKANTEYIKTIEVEEDSDDDNTTSNLIIDDDLQNEISNTNGVLEPDFFQTKENALDNKRTEKSKEDTHISLKEKLNIGQPLEFNKTENHSFIEWLQLTRFKPINRTKENNETKIKFSNKSSIPIKTIKKTDNAASTQQNTPAPLDEKLAIINRFIEENPKIQPTKDTPKAIIIKSDDTSETIMTETLARIYLEQKNYDKAIQAYKILSLKYPEKSSFFADQIKWIEELKNQS